MVHSIASTSKVKQNEPEDRPNHLRGKWREESQTLCNEDAHQQEEIATRAADAPADQ